MKKFLLLIVILCFSVGSYPREIQDGAIYSDKDSLPTLIVRDDKLNSIIKCVEDNLLSSKSPQMWQAVEMKISNRNKNIFTLQFTGFVFIPDALKIDKYDGCFMIGTRLYFVKASDGEDLTIFFNQEGSTEINVKEYTPFIMENPIWLYSYKIAKKFKLERTLNNSVLNDI